MAVINMESPEIASLVQALSNGTDLDTACHYAGLSNSAVYRWLEMGKIESESRFGGNEPDAGQDEYVIFWEELKKARAGAIVRNVAYIQRAAKNGTWQAAAWWLERTAPESFAKQNPKKATESSPKGEITS